MTPLWTAAEVARATRGEGPVNWMATGVSIDSRTLPAGDLFIALRGPNHDGHDFVATALERGAVAAMVDRHIPGLPAEAALLRVDDTLVGLSALGGFARAHSGARIIAVTGSVGKTGTKEALRLVFAACGKTFASAGSFNNHWGVPLSLARMPTDTAYGIFELGMNHPGEIDSLTRLVQPHIALITTVEPVHLGFFGSVEAIADAKAEIFFGLEPDGIAVLNRDNPQYSRLAAWAKRAGVDQMISFGADPEATVRLVDSVLDPTGSTVEASCSGAPVRFRLPVPGRHWVMNALAVLGVTMAAGCDVRSAAEELLALEAMPGRGRRHRLAWRGGILTLIDESYNASPAAMEAAFLVGTAMAALHEALPEASRGGLWRSADQAIPALLSFLQPGDVVTVKGSYSLHVDRIVERLIAESARCGT
jgi:UDP-N-acetylmuramoyl-tripeptide--D-alanyl-D-alanine ligase